MVGCTDFRTISGGICGAWIAVYSYPVIERYFEEIDNFVKAELVNWRRNLKRRIIGL